MNRRATYTLNVFDQLNQSLRIKVAKSMSKKQNPPDLKLLYRQQNFL